MYRVIQVFDDDNPLKPVFGRRNGMRLICPKDDSGRGIDYETAFLIVVDQLLGLTGITLSAVSPTGESMETGDTSEMIVCDAHTTDDSGAPAIIFRYGDTAVNFPAKKCRFEIQPLNFA